MKTKLILIIALIPLLFTFYSCESGLSLSNDYDYLHFVTDLTIQNDKLYLGIKNEKDKILANVDLQQLISTDRKSLNLNILNRLNYQIPGKSWYFMYDHFRSSNENSKYQNEVPLFIKDIELDNTHYIVANNLAYNLNNNSVKTFSKTIFFKPTLYNSNLYSTLFRYKDIYFDYKEDTIRYYGYNNSKQYFGSYNINSGIIDTLLSFEYLQNENELIRNSFVLGDSIYVCRNNSFLNVESKTIFTLNELQNDYIIETYQENNNSLLLSTKKSKLILLNSQNSIEIIDCLPAMMKEAENYAEYGITEIYLKNNKIYFIAYYVGNNSNIKEYYYGVDKYEVFSYDLITKQFKNIFKINNKEALIKYNMISNTNKESFLSKQSNLWSIAVDSQENVYLGCNGLFVLDKNGNLLNYINSFDLARMCKN